MSTAYHPRGRELGLWSGILEGAVGGRGGVLVVSAAAGIGKTRLLGVLGEQAADRGFRDLRGVGRLLDRTTSHSGTLQIFETVAARDVPGLYDGVAGLARPLLEGGRTVADPFAQTHALFWCLANLAADRPVSLLVDDAQWLDGATAALLAYVVERAQELPVAVVVASRQGAFRHDPVLKQIRERATEVCELGPLNPQQVAQIVDDLVPGAMPGVRDMVTSLSGGNALLVHQLAGAVAAGGFDLLAAAAEPAGILASYVVQRIAELGVAGRALLDAAAVLGDGASWEQTGIIAGLPAVELVEAHRELQDSQLVVADAAAVRFPHALVSEGVLEQIPRSERSRLHRVAADELLRRRRPDLAAAHLLLTEPAEDVSVVEVMLDQARVERQRGAPDNAVTLLRRAAAEGVEPGVAVHVTLALGDALLATGDLAEASELLGRAVQEAGPDERFSAARSAARALVFVGDPVGGVRLLEEFSAELGVDSAEAQQLRAELSGIAQTEHALASAGPSRGSTTGFELRAATAMSAYDHVVVWDGAAQEQARRLSAAVEDAVEQLGVDSPLIGMLVTGLVVGGGPGWSTAREVIEVGCTSSRAAGLTVAQAIYSALRSRLSFLEGRLRDAQSDGELAVALAVRTSPFVLPFALSTQVMALSTSGQTDAAQAILEEHGFAEGEVPATGLAANLLLSRVMLRRAQGRSVEAMADVVRIAPFARGRAPWPSSWTPEIARTLRAAGQGERAAELAAAHLRDAERWGAPLHVAEALLLHAEFDREIGLVERALEVVDEVPAALTRAQILCALGAAHRRAGARTRAQQVLFEALEQADALAATPLVRQIREELASCGLKPRRVARTGVAALTASELRVARLAADGLTNAEIAQQLYVSLKTVENHLTRSYAKLEIASRRELAGLAFDQSS